MSVIHLQAEYSPASRTPALAGGRRGGFSLVELLIAATIGLAVMAAVAVLFGRFGRAASDSQSIVEMSNRLRSTAQRLRQDLAGVTCPTTPPLDPDADAGYFEIVEGPASDSRDAGGVWASATTSILADVDDAILFTTRSAGPPFTGRFNTGTIQSPVAEVAWFCRPSGTVGNLQLHTLYRRQLLVVGYVGSGTFLMGGNAVTGTLPQVYTTYDVSLRADPPASNQLVPNLLSDLTRRETRFLHGGTMPTAFSTAAAGATFDAASGREGEDVIMNNVIAFDVRVYDPDAVVRVVSSSDPTRVFPGDRAYDDTRPLTSGSFRGCFLDLGCGQIGPPAVLSGTNATVLSGDGNPRSRLAKPATTGTVATYDTWSTHWEWNGVDDDADDDATSDGPAGIDQATNGVDDAISGVVPVSTLPDDPGEAEVPPPYAVPLRAVEIRIRCYDPASKQVRQSTVRHAFVH